MSSVRSAHSLRVMRLYRSALKNLQNWTVHRDLFVSEGFKLRARFDANKNVKIPGVIEKLLKDGEAECIKFKHPAPYTREHALEHTRPMSELMCIPKVG